MIIGTDVYRQTSEANIRRYLPRINECGLPIIRLEFNRQTVPYIRDMVPHIRQSGIEVLGMLMRTDLVGEINAWGDWVADIVSEFKGDIKKWEVWNEPNLDEFWPPPKNPAEYTRFLNRAYDRIKQVDSSCIVAGGSIVFTSQRHIDYFRAVLENNPKWDVVSWHPYCKPYPPTNSAYTRLASVVRPLMAEFGDYSPIWITEFGYPTNYPTGDGVSEAQQAEYLVQALEMAQNWGWVDMFIIYNWKDSESSGKYTKGLTYTDGVTPKPSFYTVKDFISWLPGRPVLRVNSSPITGLSVTLEKVG